MSLRDTLNKVKGEQDARIEEAAQRPIIIAKWKSAVDRLLTGIRADLQAYVEDGSITVESIAFRHQDESFEPVDLRRLVIRAGDKTVEVVPLGRICFGAIGLAAMRCGKREVKFSRQGDEAADQDVWTVALPIVPETDQFGRRMPFYDGPQFAEISAELVEQSLDYVLG